MKITSGVIMVGHLAAALVGGIVACAVIASCHPATPTWIDPKPLQSGVQPPNPGEGGVTQQQRIDASVAILDGIAGCFVEGDEPVAVECLEHAPRCPYEDGDPSGWPCLWVDPDTGQPWFVSSREYWD
jgi:hypothetical protein